VATKPATFMLVSFRAGGWQRNIPGFNRGNVDWFRGLRAQEKNSLWRRDLKEVSGDLTPGARERAIPAS